MCQQKHTSIILMIKLNIHRIIAISALFAVYINLYANNRTVAEVETLSYPFMYELVDYINRTDEITNTRHTIYGNCYYEFEILYSENRVIKDQTSFDGIFFYSSGSYVLSIEQIDTSMTVGTFGNYLFEVNGSNFLSSQYLFPYFTACKREKHNLSFNGLLFTIGIFWEVYIKNGKIYKLFFIDSQYDDPAYNIVYELLTGKTLMESDYIERYKKQLQ